MYWFGAPRSFRGVLVKPARDHIRGLGTFRPGGFVPDWR